MLSNNVVDLEYFIDWTPFTYRIPYLYTNLTIAKIFRALNKGGLHPIYYDRKINTKRDYKNTF